MGSAKIEADGPPSAERASEGPPHKVTISQPFLLGACDVTQEAYRQVMNVNPSHFSAQGSGRNTVAGQSTGQYPVESVSFTEAEEFCRRLSALQEERAAHRGYRLPTEAEWEYACRAGTTSRWYCGDQESALAECAWPASNSGNTTHAVASKRPNAWGLFDMHGNVYEWCSDWFSPDYYQHSPPDDPWDLPPDWNA